jgi:hypothetical protein
MRQTSIFEAAALDGKSSLGWRTESHSGLFFKDIVEFGIRGEAQKIQLQVVDGNGLVLAESKNVFSIDEAIRLLKKLPLPLSPQAPPWLKECLREDIPAADFIKSGRKQSVNQRRLCFG